MKNLIKTAFLFIAIIFMFSCGDSEKKENEKVSLGDYTETPKKIDKKETATAETDLSNKGIGPIKNLDIPESVDANMATTGADVFKKMCSACHKMDKKFVGPAIAGVTERRSPEWIMNMILNPEQMIKEDPIAKKLMIESNMAIMANQNLKEEEARAILEFFREYDQQN